MPEFSINAKNMRSSEIRKLMKLAADPSIISFSGGMPNNGLFPCDVVEELYRNLPLALKQAAFQYGPTRGYPPLLESLTEYLRSRGLPVDTNDLMITTGAQQAINLITKVLIDLGDSLITEYPSFIGGVAAFKAYGAHMKSIPLDDDGILIEELKEALDTTSPKPKMLYLTPYFHNPAGIIYSNERKKAVLDVIKENDILFLEDDPYCERYLNEEDRELTRSMKSILNDEEKICYVGTFAKIIGPGMRLGYILGPKNILEKCELAKQSMDACSPTYSQVLANAFLTEKKLVPYLEMLRPTYKRRAEIMLKALDENMPEGIVWTKPKGGFYIWVTMPEHMDSSDVFAKSVDNGAAFVIGKAFDPEGKRNNSFRLAFSHTAEEKITEGVEIVAKAIKSNL
jgi:DNA-binding transcriptional MocR family regulator